jgi:DNA-binding response OmpR family regulator
MRILVVEDEHKIAAAIKKGLEQESFAVDLAYEGVGGFDLALTEEYDCIILDLMLPGMSGLDFCRRLRQENIHAPILILTAKGAIEDKVEGFNLGADDYLVKPFSFEELLARVKALIRRPRNFVADILKIGDLEVNTQNFEVKRGNKRIDLTRREFAILEYLVRNKGKILSKDQIISHIWDYDADILPNTVEVFIKNLRRKIDRPFYRSLIKTIRGFGYKIE